MRAKTRAEQDYWLSYSDFDSVTEQERSEFLRFDSRGGKINPVNPILQGKRMHGVTGAMLQEAYFAQDCSWPGGLEIYCYFEAKGPLGIRSLHEWFGEAAVRRWATAAQWEAMMSALVEVVDQYEQK